MYSTIGAHVRTVHNVWFKLSSTVQWTWFVFTHHNRKIGYTHTHTHTHKQTTTTTSKHHSLVVLTLAFHHQDQMLWALTMWLWPLFYLLKPWWKWHQGSPWSLVDGWVVGLVWNHFNRSMTETKEDKHTHTHTHTHNKIKKTPSFSAPSAAGPNGDTFKCLWFETRWQTWRHVTTCTRAV